MHQGTLRMPTTVFKPIKVGCLEGSNDDDLHARTLFSRRVSVLFLIWLCVRTAPHTWWVQVQQLTGFLFLK